MSTTAIQSSYELHEFGPANEHRLSNTATRALQLPSSDARLDDENGRRLGSLDDDARAGLDDSSGQEASELPPADGGRQAWLFLAACFAVDALIWGFPFAFGVFQNYYSAHPDFAGSSNIAVIGTCSAGVMYFSSPIVISVMRMMPRVARWCPLIGLVLSSFSLAMSSFSTNVGHLIVTQGIFYAIGGCLSYIPCILFIDEWFIRRKGFSLGVMWSGTSLAGVIFPLLMEYLLQEFGYRTTLRLWSGLLFALAAPLAWFIRPRIPPLSVHSSSAAFRNPFKNLNFLWSRSFLLFQTASIIQAAGYFLPSIYLPTYARTYLGASPFSASASLLFINVASVFGCILMGWFTDRWPVPTCIFLASAGAAVGTFLFWGLSNTLAMLYCFGAVYGLFAGSYSATWAGVMMQVTREEREKGCGVDPILVVGSLAAGRGIGNMISGPLSEALISGQPWQGDVGFGYGSGYGPLIVFTGITAVLGGASLLWRKLGWL